jgi:hypothetical protein
MSVSDKSKTYQSYKSVKIEALEQAATSKKDLFNIESLSSKRGGLYADDTAYMGLRQEIKPRTRNTQKLKLEQVHRETTNSRVKTKMRSFQVSDSVIAGLTIVSTATTISRYASKSKAGEAISELTDNSVKPVPPIPGLVISSKYADNMFSVAKPTIKQNQLSSNINSSLEVSGGAMIGLGTLSLNRMKSSATLSSMKGLSMDYSGGFARNKNKAMKNTRNPVGDLTKLIGMSSTGKKTKKNVFRGLV